MTATIQLGELKPTESEVKLADWSELLPAPKASGPVSKAK